MPRERDRRRARRPRGYARFGSWWPSGVERPRREPALQRRDAVDESHAIVAEFPDRRSGLGKQTLQSVGNTQHRPSRRGALPHIPPKQPFVAEAAPRLALLDDADQRSDV